MAASLWNRITCAASSTPTGRQSLYQSPQLHNNPALVARFSRRITFQNSTIHGFSFSFDTPSHKLSTTVYRAVDFPQCPNTAVAITAQLIRFTGRKEVSIPFKERLMPPEEYLKETKRIVEVTFPDSARIKYLGNSIWQARLLKVTFLNFSATPYTDIRVRHDNGILTIDSNKLILDVTGLPDQFHNLDLWLSLHGELRVLPCSTASNEWHFGGWVNLGVAVNLPPPLSLVPERMVTSVGNKVVDRILSAMEGALLQGIIDDYDAWSATMASSSPRLTA